MASNLTMTSRRAQVEAVLRKHLSHVLQGYLIQKNLTLHPQGEDCLRHCLDDLLALQPTPERKEVERLITKYADDWKYSRSELVDDLMAWATGEAGRPTWCRHCVWVEDGDLGRQGWCYDRRELPDTVKQLHSLADRYVKIADEFDLCPVAGCHAPRPGAG